MKISNLMAWAVVASFLTFALPSCSSNEDPISPEVKPEGLTIIIPELVNTTPDIYTRAATEASQDEAKIDELWVYGFSTTNKTDNNFAKKIKTSKTEQVESGTLDNSFTGYQGYATYTLSSIKMDKYHVYVLANLGSYLDITGNTMMNKYNDGTLTEAEIQGLLLNFSTSNPITPGNIPMACYYTEALKDETNKLDNNILDFSQGSATLYAPLTMLCAKVRYTILFDNQESSVTGEYFSKDFADVLVDFNTENGTSAENVASQVAYKTGTASSTPFTMSGLTLSKVAYPNGETAGYLNLSDATNNLANLGTPSTTWNTDKKRAWQGIVYLPEDKNATSKENATTIKFTPTSTQVDTDKTQFELFYNSKGLQRGTFYDVVAKLVNPKTMEIIVKVKVNAWNYEAHSVTW